jgi:hypothetical protein
MGCLLIGFITFLSANAAPTDSPSGITQITWTGFDNKPSILNASSGAPTGFVLNLPPVVPVGLGSAMFYKDAIQVESKFIPKNQVTQPDINGPWFVQRRIMTGDFGKGGQATELSSATVSINKKGLAESPAGGFPIAIPTGSKLIFLEYRLGRLVTVLDKTKKGPQGQPSFKKVAQFMNQTIQVPVLVDLCQTNNNPVTFRALPCEFESIKLDILGKNGQVLFTVLPNDKKKIQFPEGQAKKESAEFGSKTFFYEARWTVRRIHEPVYQPDKGYLVQFGRSGTDFAKEADEHGPLASGLNLSGPVGKVFTIPFDVQVTPSGGSTTTRQVVLENDVTKTKFSLNQPASNRAETNLLLNW